MSWSPVGETDVLRAMLVAWRFISAVPLVFSVAIAIFLALAFAGLGRSASA